MEVDVFPVRTYERTEKLHEYHGELHTELLDFPNNEQKYQSSLVSVHDVL